MDSEKLPPQKTINKQPGSKRSAWTGLIIVIVILLISCLCLFLTGAIFISVANNLDLDLAETTIEKGNHDERIAIIHIDGVITSQPLGGFFSAPQLDMASQIIDQLEKAKKDDKVKAIILDIDSPGGEVYATELIVNKIKEIKAEGKPVIALMRNMAASGGYYIASSADKIVASNTTITGSIGVLIQTGDSSGLYEKIGIKTYTITNSKGVHKVSHDLDNKNSEDYKILQRILDDTYDQFVSEVAEGRKMDKARVIELSDGRIYSGKAAKEVGLVDEIGYMEKAIELAKSAAELDKPTVIEYTIAESTLGRLDASLNGALQLFERASMENKYEGMSVRYQLPL